MAEPTSKTSTKTKYAVVTGANKGIGFETVRQLASNGITVILTCRDDNRGLQALQKLQGLGVSDVIFHQLDVTNSASISALAQFVKSQFGKLDILVNNAGIGGADVKDTEALRVSGEAAKEGVIPKINWSELLIQTYDLAEACRQTNYYGAKRTVEALLPLLQLSDSPRIVNVSSAMGKLKNIPSERVKGVLRDVESLTEDKIDQVLEEFLQDFKDGSLEAKGWPENMGAYIVSKAALNAYTRILSKKYPTFLINCVCPGFVKTDINYNTGIYTVEEGAETPVKAALLPDDGPTGSFIVRKEMSSFEE